MISPTNPIRPVKETTVAIIIEPIKKIRILNLPVLIPKCRASSSPRDKAFKSKEEKNNNKQPIITGRVIRLIFSQSAVDKSPISQKIIECNSLLERAKSTVIKAEKRKVIATPARSKPVEFAE
jgi:hypothetical protein